MSPTLITVAADFVFSAAIVGGLYYLNTQFIERQAETIEQMLITIARYGDLLKAEIEAVRDKQVEHREGLIRHMDGIANQTSDQHADLMAHIFTAQREIEKKVQDSHDTVRKQMDVLHQMVEQLKVYSQEIIDARTQQVNNTIAPREKCDVCQKIVWAFHRQGESIICNDCWGKRKR